MIINPKPLIDLKVVHPVSENQLQPNSIDLTVKSISEVIKFARIGVNENVKPEYHPCPTLDNLYNLDEGAYSVDFNERVLVPHNMVGFITHRSSLNRAGAIITSGLYDSGFDNFLGAMLRAMHPIQIEKNARIATIYFISAHSSHLYCGQYQGKKNA